MPKTDVSNQSPQVVGPQTQVLRNWVYGDRMWTDITTGTYFIPGKANSSIKDRLFDAENTLLKDPETFAEIQKLHAENGAEEVRKSKGKRGRKREEQSHRDAFKKRISLTDQIESLCIVSALIGGLNSFFLTAAPGNFITVGPAISLT